MLRSVLRPLFIAAACAAAVIAVAAQPRLSLQAVLNAQVQQAYQSYRQAYARAQQLNSAVDTLVAQPSAATLAAARSAWLLAHQSYSRTETLRFGHPPVDDWEGDVNAWPIDEGLLDYVQPGYQAAADNPAARANMVANTQLDFGGIHADLRGISTGTLSYLNGLLGIESNVLRGYHPIEFLLWGQDLSATGPGARPYTDYANGPACTAGPQPAPAWQCARRGQLLRSTTQLLVQDLNSMVTLWNPANGSYGHQLMQAPPQEGLRRMVLGMVRLAGEELAGQRIAAGVLSGSAEDEQNCFSDSTPLAHIANVEGMAQLYQAGGAHSLAALLAHSHPDLAQALALAFAHSAQALAAVQAHGRYDQLLLAGNAAGHSLLQQAAEALQQQAQQLGKVSIALGLGPLGTLGSLGSSDTSGAASSTLQGAAPLPDEALAGGSTTFIPPSFSATQARSVLSQPAANLTVQQRAQFAVGNSFFSNAWLPAPASVTARDGLGPLYNAAACQNCHIKDGRGHPPETPTVPPTALLVKLALPQRAVAAHAANAPDPHYGSQLQDRSLPGIAAEVRLRVDWRSHHYLLANGRSVNLRAPLLQFSHWGYGPPTTGLQYSPRVAPAMSGLGLLEAIPAAQILAQADPNDANHDGISGRANWVWDIAQGQYRLGRFGWKAAQPSVRQQTASAAMHDLGLSSALFPNDDCTAVQTACLHAAQGGQPELNPAVLDALTHYAQHLAPPARRWVTPPEVQAGQQHFVQLGCATCHTPQWRTGPAASPALAQQTIRPYTDLLVHDLGPGLADGVPEFAAQGSEWRTAPLWGLHLAQTVNPSAGYLHDGRARTLEEAILWHGGEATAAAQGYARLPQRAQDDLLWFLKSL